MNKSHFTNKSSHLIFLTLLWVLPLLWGTFWGPYFDVDAYSMMRHARALIRQPFPTETSTSPLHTLTLTVLTALGLPAHIACLMLSCIGWGLTATTIYRIGVAAQRPQAGTLAASLLALSPLTVQTLASDVSWSTAIVCLALLATVKRQWKHQTITLLLLMVVDSHFGRWMLIAILWGVQWHRQRKPSYFSAMLLISGILALSILERYSVFNLLEFQPDMSVWFKAFQDITHTSEFYWLFIPWVAIGAWKTPHKAVWISWLLAIFVDGSHTARVTAFIATLWFAAVGVETSLSWLHRHKITKLSYRAFVTWGKLVTCVPLVIAFESTLGHAYLRRSPTQSVLLQQAGIWLRDTVPEDAVIFGPEVVAYWAEHNAVTWEGTDNAPGTLARQLAQLNKYAPDYCVTSAGLAWTQLTYLRAFSESYVPVRKLTAPNAPYAVTIWERRSPAPSQKTVKRVDVDIPGGIKLVEFQHTPDHATPGLPVYITLRLRATKPVTQSFYAQLSLRSPVDGMIYGQHGALLPRSTLVSWWEPGQSIAETLPVTTTTEISAGAYYVVLDIRAPNAETALPLHQNGDDAVLAEVVLGYVARPWQGQTPETAQLADVDFGGDIQLAGFDMPDTAIPGGSIDVTLYWKARNALSEDYTVFVHLLDADGQLVSSHDGQPMSGGYPTGAWLRGDTIPDTHTLAIDPNLPVGTYHLNLGMYRRPSLERLSVRDADGNEQSERAFPLGTVIVP